MDNLNLEILYLDNIKKTFRYYQSLGETCIHRMNIDELNYCYGSESNSILILVKHLSGNMVSRWTDFATSDGEKEWRNRDGEFEHSLETKEELLAIWHRGWDILYGALNSMSPNQLSDLITIRGEKQTILEAINRQLAHYSYHIGQIVFIAKSLSDEPWKTLSIAKGASEQFNRNMKNKTNL